MIKIIFLLKVYLGQYTKSGVYGTPMRKEGAVSSKC